MPIAPPGEVFAFLKKAHDDFQSLAAQLRFDKSHPLHRNIVALYGSVLELTGSCILLVDSHFLTGVPVLLRAMLEAYVDLVNLASNPAYGYALELSYLKEWLKLLQEARIGKNEYLQDIAGEPSLDGRIAELHQEKQRLEKKGYRSLGIEQKFQRARMEKEYRSLYNSLCCDAHNNLRSLMNRHIEFDSADFSVVFYKAYTPDDSAVYVGTNAELLVRATEKLHEVLNSSVRDKVATYRAQLDQLRGDAL